MGLSDRWRVPIAVLFALLLWVVNAERRLAELDLDWQGDVLLENDEGVDGDEILTKLVFVDDVTRPVAPPLLGLVGGKIVSLIPAAVPLLVVGRSDPRAPPLV